jgi:flagellar biosynthesis anti-sigma factor FlgM
MRRIWNSWTYYGTDRDSGRSDEQKTVCQETWKDREQRTEERAAAKSTGGLLAKSFERSMADALERAMDLSDVRKERVARVKKAIETGQHRVSARELAEKLIKNMRGEYH